MPNIGVIMNGGTGENDRHEHDHYPTPPATTRAILPYIADFPRRVWECACGGGFMARVLIRAGFDVASTDLAPRDGWGEQANFLTSIDERGPAIVTNPPFDLADDFIVHAMAILGIEYMALILPAGFWHAAGRTNLFDAFTPALVMPMTWRIDSTGGGNPTMNVQWCIWKRGDVSARTLPLTSNERKPGAMHVDPISGEIIECPVFR